MANRLNEIDVATYVRHLRRMMFTRDALDPNRPDGFSILVRGVNLIDDALERVIEAHAALKPEKLKSTVRNLSIAAKASMACALGAISEGELACIEAVNRLRNTVAHSIGDFQVTQHQERDIVQTFKANSSLFSGLNYDPSEYPRTLAFILLPLAFTIRLRMNRPNARIAHLGDASNTEHMAAIILTSTMSEVMSKGLENDDAAIMEIMTRHTKEVRNRASNEAP